MRKLLLFAALTAALQTSAQPIDISAGKFKNITVTGTEKVAVLDAGVLNVQGQETVAGPLVCAASISASSTIKVGTQLLNGAGQTWMSSSQLGQSETDIQGNTTNSAGNSGIAIYNLTSLTRGMDRYIATIYPDNFGTLSARITTNGTWLNAATVGTAASGTGVTASYSGASTTFLHKVAVTFAAMTAAATTDVTLAVTPPNSRIGRVKADVTTQFTGGALTAVTLTCGNAAGGNQYLLSGNVFAAPIVLGDVVAEMGAGIVSATLADFGTAAAGTNGAITVSCRFTCTTANCNAATGGAVNFYVEGVTYP